MLAGSDIFRDMQDGRVFPADHLLRLIAVKTARAFVPQQDFSVEILADDGILGGGLEDIADEVERLLRGAHDCAVEKFGSHVRSLSATCETCLSVAHALA